MKFFYKQEHAWLLKIFPFYCYLHAAYFLGGAQFSNTSKFAFELNLFPSWFVDLGLFNLVAQPLFESILLILLLISALFSLLDFAHLFQKWLRSFTFLVAAIPILGLTYLKTEKIENWICLPIEDFLIAISLLLCAMMPIRPAPEKKWWQIEMLRFQFGVLFTVCGISKLYFSGLRWGIVNFREILLSSALIRRDLGLPLDSKIEYFFSLPLIFFQILGVYVLFWEIACIYLYWKVPRRMATLSYFSFFLFQSLIMGWTFTQIMFVLPLFFFSKNQEELVAENSNNTNLQTAP